MEPEWGLCSQCPSYSIYRLQTATSISSEANEYYFYSESAQRRFQASKAQIHTLSHPHILQTYESSGAHAESHLYLYTLQTDPCLLTLETEWENRARTGDGWTQEEVLGILQQIASALAFAASKGWYCSDLSGDNFAYDETGVKVRRLHTKDGIWYQDLRPQYLSPEMRAAYTSWAKGNRPGNVDVEKAAVYGLGLLGISLLCEGFGDRVWRHEEAIRSCEGLQGKLKSALAKIIVEKPEARISLAALCELLSSDPEEISSRVLVDLNHATASAELDSASAYLSQIIENNLQFTIEVQCSVCSEPIHYIADSSEGHFLCSKHILCTKHLPAATCPLCPARSRIVKIKARPVEEHRQLPICPVCHSAFPPPEPSDWRSALPDPSLHCKSLSVCSKLCLERASSVSAMFSRLVILWNRRSRVMESYFANVDEEARADYFNTEESLNQRKSILMYNESWTCHFCHREIGDVAVGRWVVCGVRPRFVCSTQCIERGIERESICPTCNFKLTADSIKSALLTDVSQNCINCQSTDSEAQDCGHYSCMRCVSTFGGCAQCIADEFSVTQDVAAMARSHQFQHGFGQFSAYR